MVRQGERERNERNSRFHFCGGDRSIISCDPVFSVITSRSWRNQLIIFLHTDLTNHAVTKHRHGDLTKGGSSTGIYVVGVNTTEEALGLNSTCVCVNNWLLCPPHSPGTDWPASQQTEVPFRPVSFNRRSDTVRFAQSTFLPSSRKTNIKMSLP